MKKGLGIKIFEGLFLVLIVFTSLVLLAIGFNAIYDGVKDWGSSDTWSLGVYLFLFSISLTSFLILKREIRNDPRA